MSNTEHKFNILRQIKCFYSIYRSAISEQAETIADTSDEESDEVIFCVYYIDNFNEFNFYGVIKTLKCIWYEFKISMYNI